MKKRCLVLRIIYELQDLSNCIFFRDLTRLVKKSLQLDKEKKILYFYLHSFKSHSDQFSKNVQPFNSYFPHLNPMPAFILDLSSLTCPITHLSPQKYS